VEGAARDAKGTLYVSARGSNLVREPADDNNLVRERADIARREAS
jgi:hypothetical protein